MKWAKCNVGAKKETDYGYYFMWGSTTPNTSSECTWANSPFNNGSSNYDETYFNSVKGTVCPNGVLAKEYDAASQIMGDDWRMPSQSDFNELLNDTTNEWVEDYNGTGVSGRKFTSKTNGNSIFIPAAGFRTKGSFSYVGDQGNVWSSSLLTSYTGDAWTLSFDSDGCGISALDRYYGLSVRGVCK